MIPVKFPEANKIYNKPESLTDEECMSGLPVYQGKDVDGHDIIISKWQLNKEDIEHVNKHGFVFLSVMAPVLFPVNVFTEDPFIRQG